MGGVGQPLRSLGPHGVGGMLDRISGGLKWRICNKLMFAEKNKVTNGKICLDDIQDWNVKTTSRIGDTGEK